jgi:D-arabinono-1,4-lactone oxidase
MFLQPSPFNISQLSSTVQQSQFWLSPSFSGDKFRLDVNFFQYDTAPGSLTERFDPADFFRPYFEYFDKSGLPYTSHLGKYLPPGFGDLQRLRRMYPKYDEWMQVRARLDPHQIFVNPYWRKHFLIPPLV